MGLALFILLVILIAIFGFWDTLAAIVGATVMAALAVLIGIGLLVVLGMVVLGRIRGGT